MSAEELNARDMAIEEQLNFLSKQSAPKELANKPLKIKSEITREMIEDFQAEQQGSVFHPPSVLPVLETPIYDAELNKPAMLRYKSDVVDLIKQYEEDIAAEIEIQKAIEEQFNKDMAIVRIASLRKSAPAREIAARQQDLLDAYDVEKGRIEARIEGIDREIRRLTGALDRTDRDIRDADAIIQKNLGEKARVERVNRQAVKTFEDEINALNKGININQQVGESDEDYLQRIENMKGARYGQEVAVQATTFNVKRFKTKMKEILTIPESALEKIIKYLDNDKMLYEANKKFSLLKTAIEKTYGVNPRFKAGDENDLYTFIYNTLTRQFQEETPQEALVVESKNTDLLAKTKTGFISKLKLLAIYEAITGKKSFTGTSKQLAEEIIKLREKDESVRPPPSYAESARSIETRRTGASRRSDLTQKPFGFTGRESTGTFLREQDLGGFSRRGRPPISEELKAELKKEREDKAIISSTMKDMLKEIEKRNAPPSNPVGRPKKQPPLDPKQGKIESFISKGKGVEREFYPKLVPFGAIMISPAQLFYYKLLRVREPTKHSIRGMPDVRVSDDMVYILMKIINGGTPSMTELKALSDDEKTIYDAIIMKAKLHKEMPQSYAQSVESSINKLKKRLELLEGEWSAGNDNTLIKKELNSVIRQLTELKAISEVEGRKYLKQF